jgi:hypothetical protein
MAVASITIGRAEVTVDANVCHFQLAGGQHDAGCQHQRDRFRHDLRYLPSDYHSANARTDELKQFFRRRRRGADHISANARTRPRFQCFRRPAVVFRQCQFAAHTQR